MNKTIPYEVNGVKFEFKGKKWEFQITPNSSIRLPCPGGSETAKVVAGVISKAVKRIGGIDNHTRGVINRIVSPRIKLNSPIRF